jgi:excinuclease ABC subunit C
MKNTEGKILYIGKAISLKKRINNYFQSDNRLYPNIKKMMNNVQDIETILTDSETEALILENNLIKRLKPKYNIRLKDAKTYPFVKITVRESYPRFIITRHLKNDGSIYYGPYTDVRALRKTLHYIRRFFLVAVCSSEVNARKSRPCLEYQINRCAAPCADIVSNEDYMDMVEGVRHILEGRHQSLTQKLLQSIQKASSTKDFEKAAAYRDQLEMVNKIVAKQKIVSVGGEDQDFIAMARTNDKVSAQVFLIREGILLDRKQYTLDGFRELDNSEISSAFIKQYYADAQQVPREIILKEIPVEIDLIQNWLLSKGKTLIRKPSNDKEKDLYSMVERNATLYLKQRTGVGKTQKEVPSRSLKELQKVLHLERIPRLIEAFDISNFQGAYAVGSMVTFVDGEPKKNLYRRFKIKTVKGADDYGMMSEIITRRYKRVLEEGSISPRLLIIDGGKGHLNVVNETLFDLGINNLSTIAIAKRQEEIFSTKLESPIVLSNDSEALLLVRRIRDEAHRFSINYHRILRKKGVSNSILDQIPGIGPKRKNRLIINFRDIDKLRKAGIDELKSVKGINPRLAETIHSFLKKNK